ncbi:serine/threonine protein kinase [Brachybacterium phenoliresistens]|uniref:non-specific serine/threonine protein kinase n=1 Tax=Brachybacterium phenoliresistens TaxID=396014 RepID=Z9JV35_9MICO|nr:serine/threonine-protein kinase [Brachybacterium phenoliresistens]EWS81627.1 serine/threonine protein kinase [Brachybacterium phenoliresistens]
MADVIVGRFALIDLIAKGGSGSVWRAYDMKTRKDCAAKVLRQRDSADLMRFVREKGVSFDHPHLLTPYGWGAEDEHVVIAMPLVSGGTLESAVKQRGKLSEPAVVVILDQLLDGLAHVHSQGWIHRDVKPANIMFEPRGAARPHSRLADFGIAVHESDVRFTHVGMVNGTPGYMAPELFSMAEPAPSHDLYAAGVVALVALNGPIKLRDGAFRRDELDGLLRGVSPKFAAVIRRLVAPQPDQRYQDAETVRRDLPRVPTRYPLTFADGAPLTFEDTLPPLPPDAPGRDREKPRSNAAPGAMEAIRQGEMDQAYGMTTRPSQDHGMPGSSPAPSQTPPQQTPHPGTPVPQHATQAGVGGQAAQGSVRPAPGEARGPMPSPSPAAQASAGSPRTGPQWAQGTTPQGFMTGPGPGQAPTSPVTGTGGQGTGGRAGGGISDRQTLMVAVVLGAIAAVVLGAVAVVILLRSFSVGALPAEHGGAAEVVSAPHTTGQQADGAPPQAAALV